MKNSLASIELKALVDEMQVLVNGRLDNIYQPSKEELFLQFYVTGLGNKMLRIVSGKLMYMTDYKPSGLKPGGFIEFLRKHLKNTRLREIKQKGFERIVEFIFDKKTDEHIESYSLVVELFGKGNVILLKERTILSALHYQKWKDRSVMAKKEYVFPEREYNLLEIGAEGFIKMLKETHQPTLVKALAIDLGLGGVYAEEIIAEAGVDKNAVPKEFDKVTPLFDSIKKFRERKAKGFVYQPKDIVPFEIKAYITLKKFEFPTYNEALDSVLTKQMVEGKVDESEKEYNEKLEKLNNIIEAQEKTVKRLEEKYDESQKKAELIYQNYQVVDEVIKEINKAASTLSWDDIKEKLKGHKIVKEIDAKNKTVVVELE